MIQSDLKKLKFKEYEEPWEYEGGDLALWYMENYLNNVSITIRHYQDHNIVAINNYEQLQYQESIDNFIEMNQSKIPATLEDSGEGDYGRFFNVSDENLIEVAKFLTSNIDKHIDRDIRKFNEYNNKVKQTLIKLGFQLDNDEFVKIYSNGISMIYSVNEENIMSYIDIKGEYPGNKFIVNPTINDIIKLDNKLENYVIPEKKPKKFFGLW